jgi:hypothetical protein
MAISQDDKSTPPFQGHTEDSSDGALEKFDGDVKHIEDDPTSAKHQEYLHAGLTREDADFLVSVSKSEERAIFRKVDWRVVPMLAMLYLIRSVYGGSGCSS